MAALSARTARKPRQLAGLDDDGLQRCQALIRRGLLGGVRPARPEQRIVEAGAQVSLIRHAQPPGRRRWTSAG
ncbi:MAG: hypothetical protein L0H73_13645 [Nitrococcus sp.]|nr:hypothetical protein [Nitrococcus sp.]